MSKYVIRRLLLMIPTMIAVIFIVFSILSFIPGDPGRMILGIAAPQEAVDMFNHNLGLDRPFIVRFLDYVGGIFLRFDFGESYRNSIPVIDEIMMRFPTTFRLAVFGVISVVILGVPLGILAAIRRSTITDASITVYAMFLTAIPGFWFGMILMYFFALKLKWVPVFGVSEWKGYILPIITMAVPGSSGLIRLTRVTMLETVNQEYIKTARAKGAPEAIVIWKHALKNAVLPIINSIGLSFSGLLGGTVVIETIFSIEGIGKYIMTSIGARDIPAVMACTIILAGIFCVIVLLIDLIYAFIDPRIRAKFSS
ncbi:MAG: ABC transporter permease [Oscillospiraceae bacterium]|nr:ABC transporter permease [Oscillospiraceae bacterium]